MKFRTRLRKTVVAFLKKCKIRFWKGIVNFGVWFCRSSVLFIKKYGMFIFGWFLTLSGVTIMIVFAGSISNPGEKSLILFSFVVIGVGVVSSVHGLSIIDRE